MLSDCSRFLRCLVLSFLAVSSASSVICGAQPSSAPKPGEPTDPKARKTFAGAMDWQRQHADRIALQEYRKANEQDGGHCAACLQRAYDLAFEVSDWKAAEAIGRSMIDQATTPVQKALAHYRIGFALQSDALQNKKDKCFNDSCDEFRAALEIAPKFPVAHYGYGVSLARLHQDDAARKEFAAYLEQEQKDQAVRERVQRFLANIELARAKMAPPFALTTLDGQKVSLDGLAGKVVLIDFWATWCGPCRQALPHIRNIAHKFQDQPLVVLSISLDKDEAKWKDFVAKNGMTWLQYRDGDFEGQIAREFSVNAIPATFTIDADGVLQDQHVGDADIEGKLKKLLARAVELERQKATAASEKLPKVTQ